MLLKLANIIRIHNSEVPGSNPGLATKPLTKVRGFFNAKLTIQLQQKAQKKKILCILENQKLEL